MLMIMGDVNDENIGGYKWKQFNNVLLNSSVQIGSEIPYMLHQEDQMHHHLQVLQKKILRDH